MARISSVDRLPQDVRSGLDKQIRESGYCDLASILAWLKERGSKIGRSSLGRHMLALRVADSSLGVPRARLASVRRGAPRNQAALLERLGQLEFEKDQLLGQLRAMAD